MTAMIKIENLVKRYDNDFLALDGVNLEIKQGEIFALLGPNGAGKTTLISTICGLTMPTSGHVQVDGFDIIKDFREARSRIGLVPQELTLDMFETVWDTVNFTRGLFGKPAKPEYIEQILKSLSLWDKKGGKLLALSGGMKRRVMIAKALSHEPQVLFLDEPTAGVDVELRKGMWQIVRDLREMGVTIILTTHYIEEAEEMADRVGVINKGKIILVEEKSKLMQKLGKKQVILHLNERLDALPSSLSGPRLELREEGNQLVYTYDTTSERTGITSLLNGLNEANITFKDLDTKQSSLEEIFVDLVNDKS
ncbi:MAG: ABC transporter ATP-binding protein [Pseudomonadota bacterium]